MLKVRTEVLGVVEHHCAILFSQRIALVCGALPCVHDRPAEWSGVDVIVHHLNDEPT